MARAGGRRRSTRAVVVAALLLGSLAVLVRLASAHHAEVTASAACGAGAPVVRWTAIAWQTSAAEHRVNNDVRVQAYVNGTWQERVATPSICTVQAPHWATPQPYLVPVMPSVSRNTQSSGVR